MSSFRERTNLIWTLTFSLRVWCDLMQQWFQLKFLWSNQFWHHYIPKKNTQECNITEPYWATLKLTFWHNKISLQQRSARSHRFCQKNRILDSQQLDKCSASCILKMWQRFIFHHIQSSQKLTKFRGINWNHGHLLNS